MGLFIKDRNTATEDPRKPGEKLGTLPVPQPEGRSEAFAELEQSLRTALETYSNVHRGSGHNSLVTTHLYERARQIVLEYLGLDNDRYTVIFCTPRRAELLQARLAPRTYRVISSQDVGLPLGLRALAVKRAALPAGRPFQTGGGTARLVAPKWVVWAKAPDKFEAGTPAIVNVIAFARVLQLVKTFGKDAFQSTGLQERTMFEILYQDDLGAVSGKELLDRLSQTLIGHGLQVPTLEGEKPFINLDNAASTPTFAPVWEAVYQAWRQPIRVQREVVQEVRSICADVLGAPLTNYDVIFTSNTTESINLVAENFRNESGRGNKPVVVNSILEHNSNELPWRHLPGITLVRLGVDVDGFIDLKELEAVLRAYNEQHLHGMKRIKLVTLSGASNVLGTCSDLTEISRIVHMYGARLLVDAAQLVAHRKVEVEACGIDYLAFSAHKVYAPFGSGVLIARKGLLSFDPAGLEAIRSSGEENIGGIVALGKMLLFLKRIGLGVIRREEQVLTEQVLRGLAQIPGCKVFGVSDPAYPRFERRGGVIVFSLQSLLAGRIARELAELGGIGIRSGCHCAHMLIKHLLNVSPNLAEFQHLIVSLAPRVSLPGLARLSLGIENTPEEVERLMQTLKKIVSQPGMKVENPFKPVATEIQKRMHEFAEARANQVYG